MGILFKFALDASMVAWFDYDVGIPAEDITKYRPGGYHPVHLGDCFKDRIVHKLGFGSKFLACQRPTVYLCLGLLCLSTLEFLTERTVTCPSRLLLQRNQGSLTTNCASQRVE